MHKLNYLKAKFANLSRQGSDDWLEGRKYAFGGSEMATVLGNNPYENLTQLINKKVTRENNLDDARLWGHLFEPVSKLFITKERGTKIHEFGSIPHPYFPVCYSPDGILIEGDDLVLLEIKNPIWRGVDTIPIYYLDQVQCGMNIINCTHTLFAQFQFRRCHMYTDSKSYSYDRYYHRESRNRMPNKPVIAYGYLYWNKDCEFVDLGGVDKISEYIDLTHWTPDKVIINEPFNPKRGVCLKWKLFDISYKIVEPDFNFLKEREDLLWSKFKELSMYTMRG
jgi:putative phage-type endonuclease